MTWPEFFAQWGIVVLGFVFGIVWKVTRFDDARERWRRDRAEWRALCTDYAGVVIDQQRYIEQQARRLSASNRLLEQATTQPDEQFDWKAGVGVA